MASDFGGSLVSPALSQFAANVFGAVFLSALPLVLLNSCRVFSANNLSFREVSQAASQKPDEIPQAPADNTQPSPGQSPGQQNDYVEDHQQKKREQTKGGAAPVKTDPIPEPKINQFAYLFHQLPGEEQDVDKSLRPGVVVKPTERTPMYIDAQGTAKTSCGGSYTHHFETWNEYLLLKAEPQEGKVLVERLPGMCEQVPTKREELYIDVNHIAFFAESEAKHIPKAYPEEYKHGCHKLKRLSYEHIEIGAHVMAMRDTKPAQFRGELKLKKFEIYKIVSIEDTAGIGDPIFNIQPLETGSMGHAVPQNFWYVGHPPGAQNKLS